MTTRWKHVNGEYGFLTPCTVTRFEPDGVVEDAPNYGNGETGVTKHGAVLNIGSVSIGNSQSFSDAPQGDAVKSPYDPGPNIAFDFPITFAAGEEGTITKSRFNENGEVSGRDMTLRRYNVIFAAQEPPVDSFAPAPAAISKVSPKVLTDMIDLSTLPTLSLSLNPLASTLRDSMRWDQCVEHGAGQYGDRSQPKYNIGFNKNTAFLARGPALTRTAAGIFLCSDASPADKLQVAIPLCQLAINIFERLKVMKATGERDYGGVNGIAGLGGVNVGNYKIALLLGGLLFQDQDMIDLGGEERFAEDANMATITQDYIDNPQPSPDDTGRPYAWYEQNDLGMPEWRANNRFKSTYSGANRKRNGVYRSTNRVNIIQSAIVIHHFPGLYAAWSTAGRDNILNYADRLMENDFFRDPADPNSWFQEGRRVSSIDIENLPPWAENFWDAHRASGQTPIWTWADAPL